MMETNMELQKLGESTYMHTHTILILCLMNILSLTAELCQNQGKC